MSQATFKNYSFAIATAFIASLFMIAASANAAPNAKVLEFWKTSDERSSMIVSHSDWQALLDKYLDTSTASGVNLFGYDDVSRADKKNLKSYLKRLSAIDPRTLNKAEQFSYWVNLYNALTIDVVLDAYPVESIKDIRFLSSLFGPWDKNLIKIAGNKLSLNDIEHGILRPIWQDPRIHFAVNCASIGCPNLQAKAFTAKNADELLENAASEFINHRRGVELSQRGVTLSSIFDWYGSDFGENQSELLEYIADYYVGDQPSEGNIEHLESVENLSFQYDWQLNERVK